MPEVEGHIFPPYVWSEWPKFVRRSDGSHMVAENEEAVHAFLADDPEAMAEHVRQEKLAAQDRVADEKAQAEIERIKARHDKEAQERRVRWAEQHAPAPEPNIAPAMKA